MLSPPDSGVILIVEDLFVRAYLRTVLSRGGHQAVAADPEAALKLLQSGEIAIKALITNRPGAFRACAAQVPLIYTTSCPDEAALSGFELWRILRKPFQGAELLAALAAISATVVPYR